MDIAVIIRERGASGAPPGRTMASARGSIRHIRSKWADFEIQWTPETPPGMSCGWAPLRDGWVCWLAEKTTLLELRRALSASSTMDDTEIMREAIERWGFDAVHKTHSVWAGAIWQEQAAKLCFFRDRVGMVPTFYFGERSASLPIHIFSTSVALIQAHCRAAREINSDRLRRFLLNDDTPQRDDFFRGIRRLHPGETWELNSFAETAKVRRYWMPQKNDIYNSAANQNPAQFLSNQFREVIDGYQNADYLSLASVSGGLDSTFMLAMQVECARKKSVDTASIAAATMDFPSFPDVDESKWTQQLQAHLKHPIESVFLEDQWPMRFPNAYVNMPEFGPEFHPGAGYESVFIQRAMQRFGERSVFSGIGADQLFIVSDHLMLDALLHDPTMVWSDRVIEALRRVGKRRLARYFVARSPAAPSLRHLRDQSFGVFKRFKSPVLPWREPRLWVRSDFDDASQIAKVERDNIDLSFLSRWSWESVIRGLWRKNQGMNISHHLPFLRADFIEALFTIDAHRVNLGYGWRKDLLRQMGVGIIPDAIRIRVKGGLFSKFVEFGLGIQEYKACEKLFQNGSVLANIQLIEPKIFLDIFESYSNFCKNHRDKRQPAGEMLLWRVIAAELWCRRQDVSKEL